MRPHVDHRSISAAIFLALAAAFLVTTGRERPWGDAGIVFEVATRIVRNGTVSIVTEWPPMSHRGADGLVYSQYALGPSLVFLPVVPILDAAGRAVPAARSLFVALLTHAPSALLAAFTASLFFRLVVGARASLRRASGATLVLAFATIFFVYARSPFSEMLQATAALALVAATVAVMERPSRRTAVAFGAWCGVLFLSKTVYAASVATAALLVGVAHLRRGVSFGPAEATGSAADTRATSARATFALATAAFAPAVLLSAWYNHRRWGSPFESGYADTLSLWREDVLTGLWGLFLSPGKSVFLYSPPLLLSLVALPHFVRWHRSLALAAAAVALPPIAFSARLLSWAGDFAWGPRYLVFAVPIFMLPAAISFGRRGTSRLVARGRGVLAGLVVAAGVAVQVLGAAFYWDHWPRIAIHAHDDWLGRPNRVGSAPPLAASGLCDACFEDMHSQQWLPPMSPIAGHAWLLRTLGQPWEVADGSAPWRRYTIVPTPSVATYFRAVRADWWVLEWLHAPRLRGVGGAMFIALLGATLIGARTWGEQLRASRSPPRPR